MTFIETPEALARALATYRNPWLVKRLVLYRDRLADAECEVGDLGPVIVVEPGDTLVSIEDAAGFPFADAPEYCACDHGWCELAYVTGDDGSGLVLLVPEREGMDPALLAIVRTHAVDMAVTDVADDQPPANRGT